MPNPSLLISAGVVALVGVFTSVNFVVDQLESSEIKQAGLALSDRLLEASFSSAMGGSAARFKSDNSSVIQSAKAFPLTRDSQWEELSKNSTCSDFWLKTRDTADRVVMAFGDRGIYSAKELQYTSRVVKVAVGVLAESTAKIADKTVTPEAQLTGICKKASQALTQFETEARRRVSRKLQESAISPENLHQAAVAAIEESLPTFIRAYNYSTN